MRRQVPVGSSARAHTSPAKARNSGTQVVLPDLAYKRLAMVNVVLFGAEGAGDREWVLVDAGLPGTASLIERAARKRFAPKARPAAIILTHGHIDHVGALEKLAEFWDTPVYAHPLESPYLTGMKSYPAPDPSVGGGLMSTLSPLFSRGPVNVSERLHSLISNEVPAMPGWTWVHTPGHSPGHISLWRESDRTLLSGDAVITTRQESVYSVVVQKPELHGPPQYFTTDWDAAAASARTLAALKPELLIAGHGRAMQGPEMRAALDLLAEDFGKIAVPPHGRYVETRAE